MDARQWTGMYGGARQLTLPRRRVAIALGTPPTRAQLLKHAGKFGWEQVSETAAECGITLEEPAALRRERAAARRATRRPSLRSRIADMLERGMSQDAIAEAENLSPSRARRLLEEVA